MLGAIARAAMGFAFGTLVGVVLSAVIGTVRPTVVDGVGASHELVGYMDAFGDYWPLLALLGALLGVLAAGVAESGGPV